MCARSYVQGLCEGTWLENQIDLLASIGWDISRENWVDLLTTADLDSWETHPDWTATPSLLDMIETFIVGRISLQLSSRVLADYPVPAGVDFVTKRSAIVLNNQKPAAYTGAVDFSLDPSDVTNLRDQLVLIDDKYVPHICVYDAYSDDPLLRDVYATQSAECHPTTVPRGYVNDTLFECPGGAVCTEAPVSYSINGLYFCQYYPTMPGYDCNTSLPGCGARLLNALYEAMASGYNQQWGPDLAPTLLPWFDPDADWGFTFKLGPVLDYLGNIMPNKEKSVMCTVNSQVPVDLMNCTSPHYAALKQHADRYFMYNGSVIVPRDAQLDWPVDQAFLAAGGVFSYASTARNISNTFLRALFDDSTVCKGDTSGDQRICWKATDETLWNSVNPWLLGFWNPYDECDVDFTAQTQTPVEYIDASCSELVCSTGGPYYTNMPFSQQCKSRFNQRVLQPGVPQVDVFGNYLPYNLCHHRLEEDQQGCMHDQALLGGFDGLPVGAGPGSVPMTDGTPYSDAKYTVSDDMYTPSEWEIPDDFLGGL